MKISSSILHSEERNTVVWQRGALICHQSPMFLLTIRLLALCGQHIRGKKGFMVTEFSKDRERILVMNQLHLLLVTPFLSLFMCTETIRMNEITISDFKSLTLWGTKWLLFVV